MLIKLNVNVHSKYLCTGCCESRYIIFSFNVWSNFFFFLDHLVFSLSVFGDFCEHVCVLSCLTVCNPMGCSPPGSSIHGIFKARILKWVAISFSRESSQPRIEPMSPVSPALQADSFRDEPSRRPRFL
ncbi:unnamed protein product [Rangifer tarandus platyrhynchus]|uniref:Uncharacterized protein n=1 Tax=Rangifer tarandus platyrhynchus TaxID=3082113 RepID=A0AC60A7N4_RANTA